MRFSDRSWRQPAAEASSRTSRAGLGIVAGLSVLALVPTLAVPIPAMGDYPNHLARMYLLASEGAHPHYRIDFAFYPNLALDLLVPPLARVTGVEVATRLFLLASQILVLTGALALEGAVKGRLHLAGFGALLALNSVPFAWGFLNFEFGLGIALWGMAAWIGPKPRALAARALVHALVTATCFVAHLFSLGLYGYVLGLHELWRVGTGRATAGECAARLALLGLPALVLAGLMLGSGGAVGQAGTEWQFAVKAFWLVAIVNGYNVPLSVGCGVVLILLAAGLARRGAFAFSSSGRVVAAGLAGLYLAMPGRLQDTAFVDLRIVTAALLIVPAFLTLTLEARLLTRVTAVVSAVIALTCAWAGGLWWSYQRDYADLTASFAQIERGARVLVAHSGDGQDPPLADLAEYPMYHAPALAVHGADAFVPTLFTAPGKQPVTVRSESRGLAVPYGGPVPVSELSAVAEGRPAPGAPAYAHDWMRTFAYLYVVGPQTGNPMPARLDPLTRSRRFSLYRIRRDP